MTDITLIILGFKGIFAIVIFILHIILASGVKMDADAQIANNHRLFIFSPSIWGLIVLLTGLLGVALYWAIHHSTLRKEGS